MSRRRRAAPGSPHPVEGLEGDEGGPDQPGLFAQLGFDDPQARIGGLKRLGSGSLASGVEQQVARGGTKASTDDHDVRIEDVDERSDRGTEEPADLGQGRDGTFVARPCPLDQQRGVCVRPPEAYGGALGSEARGMRLEMTVAVAVSLAWLAAGENDHVPELRPTAIEPVVQNDATADAGTQRQHDHVGRVPPRSEPPFGERGRIPVVLDPGGQAVTAPGAPREVDVTQRKIHRPKCNAGAAIDVERHPVADRGRPLAEEVEDDPVDGLEHPLLTGRRGRDLDRAPDRSVTRDEARQNLRPAEIDPDNAFFMHVAATISARMPEQAKPYRVYKGGRAKGKVPLQRPPAGRRTPSGGGSTSRKPRQRRVGRRVTLALGAMLLLIVVWLVASYVSISGGISDSNARVPAPVIAELTDRSGMLSSTPTNILVLGSDGGTQPGRTSSHRSDSIMIVHTDPGKHRLAFLSIPRDLRVEIPGYGSAKINSAFQFGGAVLALRTVKNLTGLEVNHVAFVDFDHFRDLIDAVGGVEIDVPGSILANKFDCPYATESRCAEWPGWRFGKGQQHMDGRRALIYSRIRENRLDLSETDFDRARRQQQMIQATADKVTSLGTALRLPFKGGDIVKPLATDLSASELMQLGWAYFRADTRRALHCRLGGEPGSADGQSVIFGSEDNVATIAMFTGRSAPLPPPKGLPYAPGCVTGNRTP